MNPLPLQVIMKKLLDEVDEDIKDLMMREYAGDLYYQYLPDPTGTVLRWQELRNHERL